MPKSMDDVIKLMRLKEDYRKAVLRKKGRDQFKKKNRGKRC